MLNEEKRERIPGLLKKLYRFIVIALRFPSSNFRALPDFIIIGVQKGGTSSLFQLLKQHPSIKTSVFKEVHYYDFDYNKGKNWYKAFFPFKKKGSLIYGEASPYYIFHPKVPERVFKDNPKVKLILLLRDPIARAYSQFQMEKRKGREKLKTFEEAIELEEERTKKASAAIETGVIGNNINHQTYTYIARGRYMEQLDRWLKYFPREKLLVIKSENFFSDPIEVTKHVHEFLGVKPIAPNDTSAKNKGDYLPVREETIASLRLYYQPFNEQLSYFLKEKFVWK